MLTSAPSPHDSFYIDLTIIKAFEIYLAQVITDPALHQ